MQSKIRILCLMDYGVGVNTGYATVSRNIIAHLKKEFGERLYLDIMAINYFGKTYFEDENTKVISAVLTQPAEFHDDFGRNAFFKKLQEEPRPYDGIFIIQDLGVVVQMIDVLNHIRTVRKNKGQRQFKSMFYFPVDYQSYMPHLVAGLEFFDTLITYTEFGKRQLSQIKPEFKKTLKVIPHGNNPKDFYYIEDREKVRKFREEYFGIQNADKFIVTCVNRNQPRKDLPATILGFREYHKNNPNSLLYLNTNPSDPMGNDLRAILIQMPELEEYRDYLFPRKKDENAGVSIETLNMIYNASDVFLTTHTGEGWGLSVTEAMATRTPVIAPYNTSMIEIGANDRILFLTDFEERVHMDNIIRQTVFVEEVKEKLEIVCNEIKNNSPELLRRINESEKYVQSLNWQHVCRKWITYFKETFKI